MKPLYWKPKADILLLLGQLLMLSACVLQSLLGVDASSRGLRALATWLACSQSFPLAIPFNKSLLALVKWNPGGSHGNKHFSDGFVSTGYAELNFQNSLSCVFAVWVSHKDILVWYLNSKNEAPPTFKSHIHIVSHPLAHLGLLCLCLLNSSSASRTDVFSSMTEGTSFSCRVPMPSRHSEDNTNFSSSWKVSHHATWTSLLFLSCTLYKSSFLNGLY